jgi:mitogen-activated protein kinase kinase
LSNLPFPTYYLGPTSTTDQAIGDKDVTITPRIVHTSQNNPLSLSDVFQELREASATSAKSGEQLEFSDDVLEELSALDRRPGSTSTRVRDIRTDTIMVRKSIFVHETPLRQLLRELSITLSTRHGNIVEFHGAYMTSFSTEVIILIEYCEGGSLKAIGEQIISFGARIGEKVACRLAEGVRQSPDVVIICSDLSARFCKV